MDHTDIKERLDHYLDRELSSREMEEVKSHLQICAECRDSVSDWEELKAVFFKPQPIEISNPFVYEVMEKIESKNNFDFTSFLKWVFPTFGVMALFLFVSSLWTDESIAYESAVLKTESPLTIQEMAIENDWTGVEVLL